MSLGTAAPGIMVVYCVQGHAEPISSTVGALHGLYIVQLGTQLSSDKGVMLVIRCVL